MLTESKILFPYSDLDLPQNRINSSFNQDALFYKIELKYVYLDFHKPTSLQL